MASTTTTTPTVVPTLSRLPEQQAQTSPRDEEEEDITIRQQASKALAPVSWKIKIPAILCVLFFSLGSNFCSSSLSPLKSTIKVEMPQVTNARYGAIASSTHLVNGVLPILSGILIDYYGPSIASLVCSVTILVGAIVIAIGGQTASFGVLLAGQIIQGFGSTSIETAQSKIYTHLFRGTKEGGTSLALLGAIYGLDISLGRVFNLMGGLTAVPVADSTGKWYFSFWLGAILCGVTLIINIVYLMLDRALPKEARVVTGRSLAIQRRREQSERRVVNAAINADSDSEHSDTKQEKDQVDSTHQETTTTTSDGFMGYAQTYFYDLSQSLWTIPASFWLITISQLLQSGVISSYSSNSSEAIQLTRGSTRLTAGYTSSLAQVLPIVLTPLVGLFFDRFGKRMHFVSGTALLWVLVFALLAYAPSVHPLAPVLLGSLALSSNAIPFIASIPLLVPSQGSIGTAFGIWKAFNSNGSTIIDVTTGAIQDETPDGGYSRVFAFLIALKSVDVLFGLAYDRLDKRYFNSVLSLSERARVKKESQQTEEEKMSGLMKAKKGWTIAGLTVGAALVITAYVLYIHYSYKA